MRKTKIICTLGPSAESEDTLRKLVSAGMDVARFNFSHADHEEHYGRFQTLIKVREELNRPVAALLDTKGPEIRIGTFVEQKIQLTEGQTFTLTTQPVDGTNEIVSVSYKHLPKDVQSGTKILIDDGLIDMTVISKTDTDIVCRVNNDGAISNNKGVNVPGVSLSMPYISQKDRSDIVFAIEKGYDFIAASFTRSKYDVMQVRDILREYECDTIKIIAKIENLEGVENIDEIIEAADGIMIARGDMGVEIPGEDVPVIQKMIIKKVYNAGKQVITATQMLDSMMKNPRPTRAETTDVANAIYDGTSAIMLSGETANGKYPVEALTTMVRIAERTECDIDYRKRFTQRDHSEKSGITEAISHATCTTAIDLNAAAIITVTKSGKTARMISKYRPDCPIMGCATDPCVARQLNMSWGVTPLLIKEEQDTFELFEHAVAEVQKAGYIKKDQVAVITAGIPLGTSGTTNLLKVQVVGSK
jgi:pyruvate kinase